MLKIILDFNVLCILLTPSLRDSDAGSPLLMQVDDFLFQGGRVISP